MATEFDIKAEIPENVLRDFNNALDGYKSKLGNSPAVALRRGVIAFIKSLRARTPRSAKQAPLRDIQPYTGPGPHYITPKSGNFKGRALHRFSIKRKGGPDTVYRIRPAESKKDAQARHGQYWKWGLAKKSWGWFMQSLFHKGNPEQGGRNAKITADMVEAIPLREIVTGDNPHAEVTLINKLDYMRDILPDFALADAMVSATRSIRAQLRKGCVKAKHDFESGK